jgi:hypothetical protein
MDVNVDVDVDEKNSKLKFAFLVMYELRALKKTIDKLKKYIINFYNADVFILCNRQFSDDDELIKLFDSNVIYSRLYTKPDPNKYFPKDSNFFINAGLGNWKSPGNSQIYINNYEFYKVMQSYYQNYDYFISIRVDVDILFNFPKKSFFENIPKGIYSFNPVYARRWGGSGGGNFIHRDYILDYLSSYWNILTNPNYNKLLTEYAMNSYILNQETLLQLSLSVKNINFIFIDNINYYYTAETLNDYTTFGQIKEHKNVICKYREQVDEAFDALNKWKNGQRWKFNNNVICLSI